MNNGRSGCTISQSGNWIVKSTNDSNYEKRLVGQANKQHHFYNLLKGRENSFIIPKVHMINDDSFYMEKVNGEDFIPFHITKINHNIFEVIYDFLFNVSNNNDYAQDRILSLDVLLQKKEDIEKSISHPQILEAFKMFDDLKLTKDLNIPIGLCHGDFTLSNIMLNESNIYLIDFLDSFIETPLIDIVKLQQDLNWDWTINITQGSFDKVKIKIVQEMIKDKVFNNFNVKKYISNYEYELKILTIFNFMRIIPYVRNYELLMVLDIYTQLIREYNG